MSVIVFGRNVACPCTCIWPGYIQLIEEDGVFAETLTTLIESTLTSVSTRRTATNGMRAVPEKSLNAGCFLFDWSIKILMQIKEEVY